MFYYFYNTIYGRLYIVEDDKYIISITYKEEYIKGACKETETIKFAYKEIDEFLKGKLKTFSFKYKLTGTDFQNKVWMELAKIEYGKTKSYKEIGDNIGIRGYRAIGNACNKNELLFVIPCHRVVGTNNIGGFALGLDMKKSLLEMEQRSIKRV